MSYPQPSADKYAVGGYPFFRLDTPLSSPGDIYESPQTSLACAIGPNSDLANVVVGYFDDQSPGFMHLATVSPTRPLTGSIYARSDTNYRPSSRPGRTLFFPADLYDPSFRPRAFASGDAIQFIAPRLDVIQYFSDPPTLAPPRSDGLWSFQNYAVPAGKTFYLVVPYYGRRYAAVQFTNRNTTTANTFGVSGVNYAITQDDSPNPYTQETVLRAAAAVGVGASASLLVRASSQGMFDALVFSFTEAGPAPLRITTSDQDPGA